MKRGSGCDVLVVGAGAAGVAAALAAARAGVPVTLVESLAYPGGQATAAEVGTVCGLYHRGADAPPRPVCTGFPLEFANRLAAASGTAPECFDRGLHFLPYEPAVFRSVCADLLGEPGITVCTDTRLTAVETAGGAVTGVNLAGPSGTVALQPRAVVDATGEGTVARLAGARLLPEPEPQSGARVCTVDGWPETDARASHLLLRLVLARAVRGGFPADIAARISLVPGSACGGRARLKLGLGDLMGESRERQEILSRARAEEVVACLAREPELTRLRLAALAERVGVRSGARAAGRHVLTEQQVLAGATFADGVVRAAWPVEWWGRAARPEMAYAPEGQAYEIPLGCLVNESFANLYQAGRGLSATGRAAASARVIGTCLATGYAAGFAAAGRVRGRTEAEAIPALRTEMGIA